MNSKNLNTLAIVALLSLLCVTSRAQSLTQQLIYSNNFVGGSQSATVDWTQPAHTETFLGGSANAEWTCTVTNPVAAANLGPAGCGTIYQGGNIGTNQGIALLPLNVQTNAVYVLNAQVGLPASMTDPVEMGFTVFNQTNSPYYFTNFGFARFNDAPPTGYGWCTIKAGAAADFYGGSKTTAGEAGPVTPGSQTYNLEIILSTLFSTNTFAITNFTGHGETNDWMEAFYINGVQMSTNIYLANPANGAAPLQLNYCGIGQATFANQSVAGIQWNYFAVSTPLAPIIGQQPAATNSANQNSIFTNTVEALADTNGGRLVYQWYTNGIPLVNGGNISGATNASLIINGVLPSDAGTNYYVVITNTYGAVTSSPASLFVFGPPVFTEAFPLTYTNLGSTNLMFLYGGSGSYYGSSPFFLVSAAGAQPMSYYWFTNGVPVGGANSNNLAFTNLSMTGPTTIMCIASNFDETATNNWAVTYLPSPTTPFQAAVMAANPLAYWRLNDTNLDGVDNGGGDDGYICHDYVSGNDGIYTNVILANNQPSVGSYSPMTDPSEPSAQFGNYNGQLFSEDANSIGGNNIDFSSYSNAEYTVALWANGFVAQGAEPGNAGLFCKGYFSGEEACLDIDPHTFNARFTLRNAAGTQFNIVSTEYLGTDPNWHFIVGTCDESNGLVSLYVDGVLQGQTSIPTNSGIINSANTPIMIGARSSTASAYGDNQFEGNINDVAVYGYAMSASAIISQYQAAGYAVTPYVLLLSTPPTNVVYLPNSTVTLSATAYGTPPFGYYWTNLTIGGVLESGSASVAGPLNATLIIPNISSSLSGDQLELVVTNASASTSLIVNLSAAPAPVTLGYANSILYSNSFDGGSGYSLNGTASSAANFLVGGTNADWICTYTNSAPGSGTVYANGAVGTNAGNALVPFTPEPGFVYTMTGSLTEPATMGNWVSMGFTEYAAQQSVEGFTRFDDNPPNGYGWMYVENGTAAYEIGAQTSGGSISGVPVAPTTNILQLVLNTVTNGAWTEYATVNGIEVGSNTYSANPPIGFAGIGQNAMPGSEQWNYWTLTAVSPYGYPPYLLAPLPPTNSILLTNSTVTLSASAIGTGPWGYYWINNSTVLASGTTASTAPNSANLSVPTSSLSAGPLELVLTNALGTNITTITLVSPVNPNPTNIVFSAAAANQITLSWPTDHTGWQLQAQTNRLSVGINTNWANVSGSTLTNKILIPISLTNGTVFYRLIYTP